MTPNKLAVYFVANMVVADMVCGRYGCTPSVPMIVLLFNGRLLCGFNVPIKRLN